MLEDLILTCVNKALKKVDSAQATSLENTTYQD